MGEYSRMERQVDISFAHNGGSAVSLSSNAYGRFGHLSASNDNDDGHKMANACNVCGWVKGVTATMGIPAIFGQTLYYEGSICAVIDESGTLEEICHYYPYGGLMGAAAMGVQPHKYRAKELDRENGLDLYDSHARWYDFATGTTTTQDPLAEIFWKLRS